MGIEHFYYLLADHPSDVAGLIRASHEPRLRGFDIVADGPWDSANLTENTSTYYISPRVYEQYNMPHQRDFAQRVKARGKPAILHTCGHVRTLLPLIRETGCDGIHLLTPPPTGDTPWEEALDVIGEDLIIIGALDPTVWVSGPLDCIGPALDQLITPRLREANFMLHPCSDEIPVPLERFVAVKRWVDSCATLLTASAGTSLASTGRPEALAVRGTTGSVTVRRIGQSRCAAAAGDRRGRQW